MSDHLLLSDAPSEQRRLRVQQRLHDIQTKALASQLRGVTVNYMHGLLTYGEAAAKGEQIITSEYETLLRITLGQTQFALHKQITLTKKQQRKMDSWRNEAVRRFKKILRNSRR